MRRQAPDLFALLAVLALSSNADAAELSLGSARATVRIVDPAEAVCSHPVGESDPAKCLELRRSSLPADVGPTALAVVNAGTSSALVVLAEQPVEAAGEMTAERLDAFVSGMRDGAGPDVTLRGFSGAAPFDLVRVKAIPAIRLLIDGGSGENAVHSAIYVFFRRSSIVRLTIHGGDPDATGIKTLAERIAGTIAMPNDASPYFGETSWRRLGRKTGMYAVLGLLVTSGCAALVLYRALKRRSALRAEAREHDR